MNYVYGCKACRVSFHTKNSKDSLCLKCKYKQAAQIKKHGPMGKPLSMFSLDDFRTTPKGEE